MKMFLPSRFPRPLSSSIAALIPVVTLFVAMPGVQAADISKANNTTALSLAGSYTGGVLPGSGDRISFDATASTAGNLTALGFDATAASNLSIMGILVVAPAGPVTINNQPANVAGSTFNIGTSGIDMTAATQNLTINAGVSLSASQTWDVLTARTLTIGTNASAQAGLSLGSNVLTVQGAGTTAINDLIYGTGSITKAGAGTLTLNNGLGSGAGPNTGSFFSGGINQSAGVINISSVNASGSGPISITGGTMTISQSQFLATSGATVNGGTLNVNVGVGIAGGTVTLTSGTLTSNAAGAFQYVTVAANGGTFTPNAAASTIGALSGSVGFTLAAGSLNLGSNNATATYNGNIGGAVASNVTKTGSGTQTLNGTNATTGTLTANGSGGTLELGGQWAGNGAVAVNAGTLRLNFNSATAPASNILLPATLNAAGTAGGGTLTVVGKDNSASSQTFTSTTFNSGTASTFSATAGAGSGTIALNLGSFSRSTGSAANFILPSGTASATNSILTTSGADGAGALLRNSALAAYGTIAGSAFAAKDGTNAYLTPLTGSVSAGATSLGTSLQNSDIDGVNGNPTVNTSTINTIRFNDATAARTLTINPAQTLTVTSAGILVSSAVTNASRITGGSLTSGATSLEVLIHQFSAQPFTLDTVVTGTGVALTKAGPGTLVLTKANTLTGTTYVNSGVLQIGAGGGLSNSIVNLASNDPTAVFDVNNQTASVKGLAGGAALGGYVTLGSSGVLNLTANGGTLSGSLVGGVNSVINATSNTSNPGFQASNLAFYGSINTTASGASIGVFNTSGGFLNSPISLIAGSRLTTGGGFLTRLDVGNLNGAGTVDGGTTLNTSPFTLSVGYLGATGAFSGAITNGTAGTPNVVTFAKFGSGTQTLSGNSTYTGTTTIFSGGVVFDYSTGSTTPLASTGNLVLGGGTATFKGSATGAATAITTPTFTNSSGQLERLTLDNNGNANGVSVTLKTAVINGVNTLGSSSATNVVLFDTSSSSANVLKTDTTIGTAGFTAADTVGIRTYNGLLVTGNTSNVNYRSNILIRDTTGVGFATTGAGNTIIRNTTLTSLNGNTAGALTAEDSTANYVLTANLTRTVPAFFYNTVTLDTSSNSVALITNNIDTFTRFGNGSGSTSGRGVLATGTNGATITSGGGTNQPTYFYNYQTGTIAGQTLTLNMPLFGDTYINGTGLTVATDKVDSGNLNLQSGVFRETLAQSSGDALTPGAGLVRLYGGVLEIGADLTGSTSATSTADFSRSVGANPGQVQLMGDTGFSAFGANRTVNLGGSSTPTLLVWGNDSFLVSPSGNNVEGNQTFRLSSAYSNASLDFQNPIAFGSITRQVDVANGSAGIDAVLSGVLSGVAPLNVVTANSAPAITNAAAGLTKNGLGTLSLTAANTYKGQTTITAGTLLVNNITGSGTGTGAVVVNSGGTLGGSGTISGSVSVAGTGKITGGTVADVPAAANAAANVGSLTTGALTLASTSNVIIDIGTSSSFDKIFVIGAASLGSSTLTLNIATGITFSAPLVIIDNDGVDAFSGTFASIAEGSTVTAGGYSFTATYLGGTGNDFALTAVPEPSTWVGAGLMVGLAAWSQRKRLAQLAA